MRATVARRWVVAVVAVLVVVTAMAVAGSGAGPSSSTEGGPGAPARGAAGGVLERGSVAAAVERTIAAGSARLEGTYEPATGPPVELDGRASFRGPEAEVTAAAGGELPAHVRVTEAGAWVRPPGSEAWTPVTLSEDGALTSRGWAEVLRNLERTSAVWADAAGRIVRVRMPRDRRGGTLDVRFSEFGTEVVTVPP